MPINNQQPLWRRGPELSCLHSRPPKLLTPTGKLSPAVSQSQGPDLLTTFCLNRFPGMTVFRGRGPGFSRFHTKPSAQWQEAIEQRWECTAGGAAARFAKHSRRNVGRRPPKGGQGAHSFSSQNLSRRGKSDVTTTNRLNNQRKREITGKYLVFVGQ